MVSMQKTFDTVVAHLRRQGHKAIDNIGGCYYRLYNGDKCAIGCLIPDAEYRTTFERHWVKLIYNLVPSLSNHHYSLLASLQSMHDNVNITLEDGFAKVALLFHLEFEPLKDANQVEVETFTPVTNNSLVTAC